MARQIHVHIHRTADKKVAKTKDAAKFVTKQDIRLPNDPELGNWSGKIMSRGTVVYKEGSGYRPWFHKGSVRLNINPGDLVTENNDSTRDRSASEIRAEIAKLEAQSNKTKNEGLLADLMTEIKKLRRELSSTKDEMSIAELRRMVNDLEEDIDQARLHRDTIAERKLSALYDTTLRRLRQAERAAKVTRDAATVGKKYRTSKGIVTYLGPDTNGRHGDILVKNASGFTLKMHEDDLGSEFTRDATRAYLRTDPTQYAMILNGRVAETYPRTAEGKRRAEMEIAEENAKTKDAETEDIDFPKPGDTITMKDGVKLRVIDVMPTSGKIKVEQISGGNRTSRTISLEEWARYSR